MTLNFRFAPLHAAIMLMLSLSAAHAQSSTPAEGTGVPANGENTPSKKAKSPTKTLDEVHVTGSVLGNSYNADSSSVGAKVPAPLRDIPQSVVVVNRALLDAQGAASFQDALRNVPGITIGGAEGGQIGNNINLRGFTARTDIYMDGFRDRGQYYRDTFDLSAIEVLKGPSSMLFGRGSTGGVINQVSKEAELKPLMQVSATVGSDDRYRGTADINQPMSATSAVRLNVFGQDTHSTRDRLANKDYGIAPSLRFGIGTPTEITLSALLQHNDDMPDYGFPAVNGRPVNADHDNFYGLTNDRTIQDVGLFNARIQHVFNADVTLRSQLQYGHYTTDARETAVHSVVTSAGVTLTAAAGNPTNLPLSQLYGQLQSHDRVIHDRSLDSQTDLISNFETAGMAHTLIAGVELGHDSYDNQTHTRNGLPLISLLNPSYRATPAGVTTVVGNDAKASADTFAAYVNDTVKLNDQWQLIGGLRRDRFKADISNTLSLPAGAAQTNYFTSVRGGVIYQPSEQQSYYVSYGTSFNPSLETLTVTNGTQNLPPEKNRSYEIGGKWDLLDQRLELTSAVFEVTKTNALDGTVRVRGAEVGASGHLTDHWQIFSGYTHLDARIVKALDGTQGNVPANTPRNSATAWSTYTFAGNWELGGGFSYLSQRYAANTDVVSTGGYTRWDATLAYHQPRYDLRLNLLNMTDKRYFDALIPSDGGRSVPGVGRTELITVTFKI
ncbi:TonB-dependent receptor [Dyella silvatica]|uniref:TonB-dependent receptor n=1 Tax=Dyella silvatica TaxID=2992128 RepID=UPI00225B4333|nr:TonB-dependent siderophore receptor [Dyella silvatica]